jgi:hypothetical protein
MGGGVSGSSLVLVISTLPPAASIIIVAGIALIAKAIWVTMNLFPGAFSRAVVGRHGTSRLSTTA